MTNLLLRLFVKNYNDTTNGIVREKYGILSSVVGIFLNVVLSCCKFFVGVLSNSISIKADAVNNLADAGSSIISLLSFKLSNKPADKEHPFGHERVEYIASLVVSFFIINFGIEMFVESGKKFFSPQQLSIDIFTFVIIIFSILIKLWLYLFNGSLSKKINSTVLKSVSIDSITDVISTFSILIAMFFNVFFNVNIDGFIGVVVSFFIICSGISIVKEAFNYIVGIGIDENLKNDIQNYIMNYNDIILSSHDLMVHSYGHNRNFATVHVEVSYKEDFLYCHDIIDNLEKDIIKNYNIHMVIHLDPIVTDDLKVNSVKKEVVEILKSIDDKFSMHDFRMVNGDTHTNLIFEVEVPYSFKKKDKDIIYMIDKSIKDRYDNYYTTIEIDRI